MLDLAKHIVETKSGHFEPDKFEDHYEAALQDLLEKKKNGMPIAKAAAPSKGNVINLMDALKASLKTTGKSEPAAAAKPTKSAKKSAKPSGKLAKLSGRLLGRQVPPSADCLDYLARRSFVMSRVTIIPSAHQSQEIEPPSWTVIDRLSS
jgi:hypothetical protein